ncbi:hypothetical protein G6F66_015409 [Rhizopus arrhizus]|nr:hypothetical protein G6F66_015409 [Rhizopus arrhizus]
MRAWVPDDGNVHEISGPIDHCWVIGVPKSSSRPAAPSEAPRRMSGYSSAVVTPIRAVAEASLRSAWRTSGRRCSSARPSPTGNGWARAGACAQSITPAGSWPGVWPSRAASE